MPSAKELLASIDGLLAKEDAGALVALEQHEDKKVRKSARRALHRLRSKGVEIPEAPRGGWDPNAGLKELRGDLEPLAMIDTRSSPGLVRITLSTPDDQGASLYYAVMTPEDHVVAFEAYWQTDGQRQRLVRDWRGEAGAETLLPADWAQARISWARDQTVAAGHPVPKALDDALGRLGSAPESRPASPNAEAKGKAKAKLDAELLAAAGAADWPPLFDPTAFAAVAEGLDDFDKPECSKAAAKAIKDAIKDSDVALAALNGPIANYFEDVATEEAMRDNADLAAQLVGVASTLRKEKDPTKVAGVVELMHAQFRAAGIGHVHGPDCDHDH